MTKPAIVRIVNAKGNDKLIFQCDPGNKDIVASLLRQALASTHNKGWLVKIG